MVKRKPNRPDWTEIIVCKCCGHEKKKEWFGIPDDKMAKWRAIEISLIGWYCSECGAKGKENRKFK